MHKYMADDLNNDNNNDNSNKVFSVVFMWVKPVLYLFTFLMNTVRRLKIYLLKVEKSLSAEMDLFLPSRCSSEK